MSQKYTGGFITKSPVAPTSSAASGIWTLDQQQQAQKAGTWPSPPIFIEDLFSTYLYTGNGSTQTITNGINLSGQGGLVWQKRRDGTSSHYLFDTARGNDYTLNTNSTSSQGSGWSPYFSFGSSGFSVDAAGGGFNISNENYASWTFREQPKFFDVVTYTGAGNGTTVSHNLGSTPGCVIVKATSGVDGWFVYHRSLTATTTNRYLRLDTTAAEAFLSSWISVSDTTITFPTAYGPTAGTGTTYVAYLFAHDAGGFPVSGGGSTNGITCGTFVTNGSGGLSSAVNLGYEAQWLLVKNYGASENWQIYDTMRGMSFGGYSVLYPNLSNAEYSSASVLVPTATGFNTPTGSGPFASFANYIYIAIRRGPMKPPTVGTSVFDPEAYSGDNSNTRVITTGFPPDMVWTGTKANGSRRVGDRLRGLFTNPGPISTTSSTSDEQLSSYSSPQMNGWQTGDGTVRFENSTGVDYVLHAFRRAPGFFDIVCYTGTGAVTNFTHNLGVVPELMIVKRRDSTSIWAVYAAPLASAATKYLQLQDTSAALTISVLWNNTAPTSTVFTIGASSNINTVGSFNVAYLFATLAGVSKVGSYTGTSAAQTINCGFTSGARFVLIKNASDSANWYLYDSARGITAGNDPYLLINSSSPEDPNTNFVDTDTTGFKLTAAAPAALNFSGDTYIFLAIA